MTEGDRAALARAAHEAVAEVQRSIRKWVLGAALALIVSFLGGAFWLGDLDGRIARNTTDIAALTEGQRLQAATMSDIRSSLSQLVARLEASDQRGARIEAMLERYFERTAPR